MVVCVEEMLKWKRVCHTFEAFYFCQSGIFFFAAYICKKGRLVTNCRSFIINSR